MIKLVKQSNEWISFISILFRLHLVRSQLIVQEESHTIMGKHL